MQLQLLHLVIGFKSLVPVFQPKLEAKPKRDTLYAQFFPCFEQVTSNC